MKDTIQSADSIRDGLSDVGKSAMDSVKGKAANKMQQSGYKGFSPSNINRSNDFSNKFDKSREGQSPTSDVNKEITMKVLWQVNRILLMMVLE